MPTKAPPPIDTYPIYVGFDQIKSAKERDYFLNLPTTFHLQEEDVNKLRKVGAQILDESEAFRGLCSGLRCEEK